MYTLDTVIYSPVRSKKSGRVMMSESVVYAIFRIGRVTGRSSLSVGDVQYVINRSIKRDDEKLTEQQVAKIMRTVAKDYTKGMCYTALAKGKRLLSIDGYFFQYK